MTSEVLGLCIPIYLLYLMYIFTSASCMHAYACMCVVVDVVQYHCIYVFLYVGLVENLQGFSLF